MLNIEEKMNELTGFWTRRSEMIEDICEAGFEDIEDFGEYLSAYNCDDEYMIYIGGTENTMVITEITRADSF